MDIYGLSGKSGTGKSFQALNICRERNIPYLIDDGLFIGKSRVYAGKSAKRAGTMIGAVKTALFSDDEHREEVVDAICRRKPEAILIIGTSDKMIYRIAERLDLPEPKEIIHIEDISSPEDIEKARRFRDESGKHAIPVPAFQLKREFSGYFLKPMRILKRAGGYNAVMSEKTEVRPTFSYLGGYVISERAVYDIIRCASAELPQIKKITRMDIRKNEASLILYMDVILEYGGRVSQMGEEVQKRVRRKVEHMTGFDILAVNITVKGLI